MAPKTSQDATKTPQATAKTRQEAPKTPQDASKTRQDADHYQICGQSSARMGSRGVSFDMQSVFLVRLGRIMPEPTPQWHFEVRCMRIQKRANGTSFFLVFLSSYYVVVTVFVS